MGDKFVRLVRTVVVEACGLHGMNKEKWVYYEN